MLLRLPLALLATLPLVAPAQVPLRSTPQPAPATVTLVDVLSSDPDYTELVRLLQRARLIPTLNRLNGSTFFAPNNEAIERYRKRKPTGLWVTALALADGEELDDNVQEELRQHLFYHLLNYTVEELPGASSVMFHETLYYPRKPTEPPSREPPPYPPWMPIPGGSLGGLPQRVRVASRDDNLWAGVDSSGAGGVELASKEGVGASNGIIYGLEDVIEQPANIRTCRGVALRYI